MTAAILSLLAALIPFGIWLWKRRAAKRDDPIQQHRDACKEIQKPVAPVADTHLADELDELERLQRAKGDRK